MNITFCKTTLGEEEKRAINEVIDSGWVVQGRKTKEFEEKFADYVSSKYATFVDSCTSALDLSLKWHLHKKHIKKRQSVNVPSLTFASSAEVIVNNGLRPIFLDISRDNYCLSGHLPGPVIKVHLTGNKSDATSDSFIIEDSAHLIQRGQCLENPNLVCFSFYATKNMTTIQGGMIATNDEEADKWLKKARDHGISKGTTERYKDGDCMYEIEFVGWREKSDDVHATIGLEQLKKLDNINENRQRVISLYNRLLGLKRAGLHVFPILVDKRPEFLNFMRNNGIQCSIHSLPLHKMPAFRKYAKNNELLNTEYLGERLVSLPLFPQLTNEEVEYISKKVLESGLFING